MDEYEITDKTIKEAYKPFDVVTNENGDVGFIQEVSCNECQPEGGQISYSVEWLVGSETVSAWWSHDQLTVHCNLMVRIGECMCNSMGDNQEFVKRFFQ